MRRAAELRHLLDDIIFWGERLAGRVDGYSEATFIVDQRAVDAACWCISCVGGAAGALLKQDPGLAEMKLSEAYAMRNRITHGYFAVDEGIVWAVCQKSVPEIVAAARQQRGNLDVLP